MLYTASFFDTDNHVGIRMSIARSAPTQFKDLAVLNEFVPEWELLKDWKDKAITWIDYTTRYYHYLDVALSLLYIETLNIYALSDVYHVTLLCWERYPAQCHRSLAAAWLQRRGLNVIVR